MSDAVTRLWSEWAPRQPGWDGYRGDCSCPACSMMRLEFKRWLADRGEAALAALRPVAAEVRERAGDLLSDDTWCPDAHVQLTLTVAECRAVLAAAKEVGDGD